MFAMNRNRLYIFILTVLLSFGGSFFFSGFPDKTFILLKNSPIRLGLPPQFSLPPSARRAIFELSGEVLNSIPLLNKETWENSTLDAALVPRSWLKSERQEVKSDFFSKELFNDFQFDEDSELRALPLFWKAFSDISGGNADDQNIQLLYFVIQNPFHISQRLKKALVSQIVQSLWTQETGWASTLIILDNLDFPNHLKAQNFKNYSLKKIKLERFSNSPLPTTTSPPTTIPVLNKKKSKTRK